MPFVGIGRIYAILLLIALCGGCTALNGVPNAEPNFDVSILLPPNTQPSLASVPPQTLSMSSPIRMPQPPDCRVAFGAEPPPSASHAVASPGAAAAQALAGAPGPSLPPPDTDTAGTMQYYRNLCVAELIDLIDFQYSEYKKSFRQTVNDTDLFADLAVLGLGTATALTPGTTTKSILGGVAAAVTGAKTAINTDVFYNASIIVLINQMDADRQNEKCIITAQLSNPVPTLPAPTTPVTLKVTNTTTVTSANTASPKLKPQTMTQAAQVSPPKTYSMFDASNDLLQYYEAGTFTHALQSLEAKSGSQAIAAKQQVTNQKTSANPQGNASNGTIPASSVTVTPSSAPSACPS